MIKALKFEVGYVEMLLEKSKGQTVLNASFVTVVALWTFHFVCFVFLVSRVVFLYVCLSIQALLLLSCIWVHLLYSPLL